jgi:hypothetical protein
MIVLEIYRGADAAAQGDTVNRLYREVFRQPPFSVSERGVARQRAYYAEISASDGFLLCLARVGRQYVGFGYGRLLSPSSDWWVKVNCRLPSEFVAETGTRTFVLEDFGVRTMNRRHGIGRAIHDALLMESGAERATLSVRYTADAALAAYRGWGWRKVGPMTRPPRSALPPFDVLVLDAIPRTVSGCQ